MLRELYKGGENTKTRTEFDSMGAVEVPDEHKWGAQTQRSYENFKIGTEKQPLSVISAFARLKAACARANRDAERLKPEQADAIIAVCKEIEDGKWNGEFPLSVWQTGSGTQTNMNVNEVISKLCAERGVKLHPNDHVNLSQSSNDTYPTAMYIAASTELERTLLPSAKKLADAFADLEKKYPTLIKIGRTHLQDAVPISFAQEVSGWRELVQTPCRMIEGSLKELKKLAIGGTAVGTGLNAPKDFDISICNYLNEATEMDFCPDENKFHALTSRDALVYAHGALKALAANLMKIANDIRWLASGPRSGLGELTIPANEPGSSIMPGKVNPTQCEALTMVAAQVMGNDATIGFAASQGNFQLNVFQPVMAFNFLQSVQLLADSMDSFRIHCVEGIIPNAERMEYFLKQSLMLVTCLTPIIGYDQAAECAKKAQKEGTTLKEAVLALGCLTETEFDELVDPSKLI